MKHEHREDVHSPASIHATVVITVVGVMGHRKRQGLTLTTRSETDERRASDVETNRDRAFEDPDRTVPDEIADLDHEVRAMFERVRVRLGMAAGGPELIGRYELQDWIGRGGMGEVYRAHDLELDREVALKVIAPQPGSDVEVLRRRLQREAQLLAKLDHPNIVKIHDAGIHQARAYFVMELVRGTTLRQLQSVGALSTEALLDRYIEAGRGLAAAHAQGVIHRDFKPDNVFVGDDQHARVGDFGLGYLLGGADDDDESLGADAAPRIGVTEAGELLGTRGYMAPEQLRGESSDARADQFALCVAIWEGLTGARPFAGASVHALLEAIEAGPRGGETIDGRLARALRVGLSPQAERRHSGVGEVVRVLEELRERPARRRRRRWLGSIAVVTVVAAALLGAWLQQQRAALLSCEVVDEIDELVGSPEWTEFSAVAQPETTHRFKIRIDTMAVEARRSCRTEDVAMQQHLTTTLHSLRSLIAQPFGAGWNERVALFEQEFLARATVPMTDRGYEVLLTELQPLEDEWDLQRLLGKCDELLSGELDDIDRAAFLLRCGRAKSIQGKYDDAIEDFRAARHLAGKKGDRQRSLTAALWLARIYLIRLQDYARGEVWIENASNLFAELHATAMFDRRWADHDELLAISLARGHGSVVEAVALQRRVVARQLLFGETDTRVRTLVNLGMFEELSGAPQRAAIAYRMALHFEPEDPEALYEHGRLLFVQSGDPDEVRAVMEQVLADPNHDLHLAATAVLLGLAIESELPARMDAEQRRLTTLLRDDEVPRTPDQESQAWLAVAVALALLGDRQAELDEAASHLSDIQLEIIDPYLAAPTKPQQPPTP
jgi:serine/threonine protein kinase/tetratricopeptide (TPR) repeat protein